MKVLFFSPNYPPEMRAFTRGLGEVGAEVIGVGDTPVSALDPVVRRVLSDYLHVPSTLDVADVDRRVSAWPAARSVDRVETNWEPLQMFAAELRERWGLPGMRKEAVLGFRDKVVMRERLEKAGIRVPKTLRVTTRQEAQEAAERIGYPLIVKPVDGAGSADTWRVENAEELERALALTAHLREASVEELIVGEEHTYETITADGGVLYESVCRYEPNVLEARKNEWISPIIMTLRDRTTPKIAAGVEMGRRVLEVLGMGSGFSHMEWFSTASGEAIFGEVACRAPGANMVDLMNYAGDVDLFREWARAVTHGRFEAEREQRYHAAIVFWRARGEGRIRRIGGLAEYVARHRREVARIDVLPIGAPRRDWRKTFLSDGNVVVRHPDHDTLLELAREAARTVWLEAG